MIQRYLKLGSLLLVAAATIVVLGGTADARWRCNGNGWYGNSQWYGNGYTNNGWYGNGYANNGWYGNGYSYGNGGYYYGNGYGNNLTYMNTNQAAAPNNGYVTNRPAYGNVNANGAVNAPQTQPMSNAPVAPAPPNAAPRAYGGQTTDNGALPNPQNSNRTVQPATPDRVPATQGGTTDVSPGS